MRVDCVSEIRVLALKVDQFFQVVDTLRCKVRGRDVKRRARIAAGGSEMGPGMLGPDVQQRPETLGPREAQAYREADEASVNSAGSLRTSP